MVEMNAHIQPGSLLLFTTSEVSIQCIIMQRVLFSVLLAQQIPLKHSARRMSVILELATVVCLGKSSHFKCNATHIRRHHSYLN